MNLVDAIAVVTGGASGIGRSLALAAASRGAKVAVVDVEKDRADRVAVEIAERNGIALSYACDVRDAGQMRTLADRIRDDLGGVNLLFNNAGVIAGNTLEKTSLTDATWLFSVNVIGVFNGVQAFLPHLKAAQAAGQTAHITNTGSENSLGLPALGIRTIYTASKHALLGLTDALRRDLHGTGIGVSLLCPGLVSTELFDARRNRPDDFGGAKPMAAEAAERARTFYANGQDPALTAELCLEGIECGDFLIITDPSIRDFATKRHNEVEAALDKIDQRIKRSAASAG